MYRALNLNKKAIYRKMAYALADEGQDACELIDSGIFGDDILTEMESVTRCPAGSMSGFNENIGMLSDDIKIYEDSSPDTELGESFRDRRRLHPDSHAAQFPAGNTIL